MSKKRKLEELASSEPRVVMQRPRGQLSPRNEETTQASLRDRFGALERAIAAVLAMSATEEQWAGALGGDRQKVNFIATLKALNAAGDLKCLDLRTSPPATGAPDTTDSSAATPQRQQNATSSPSKQWPPPLPPINNPNLLTQVFTHSTFVDLSNPLSTSLEDAPKHYQRLEFLGDAALHYLLSKLLYHRFPTSREGYLSQLRSSLENNRTLYGFAQQYNLHKRIRLGKDAVMSGADNNIKLAADVLEAYIGALVLDTPDGMAVAEKFVAELVEPELKKETETRKEDPFAVDRTAKQRLGLLAGGVKGVTIRYDWTSGGGGNRDGYWFTAFLTGYGYKDLVLGRGWGGNKGDAAQRAALDALQNETLMEEVKRKKDEHLTSLGIERKGKKDKGKAGNNNGEGSSSVI